MNREIVSARKKSIGADGMVEVCRARDIKVTVMLR
jgi:hypothetical protein